MGGEQGWLVPRRQLGLGLSQRTSVAGVLVVQQEDTARAMQACSAWISKPTDADGWCQCVQLGVSRVSWSWGVSSVWDSAGAQAWLGHQCHSRKAQLRLCRHTQLRFASLLISVVGLSAFDGG